MQKRYLKMLLILCIPFFIIIITYTSLIHYSSNFLASEFHQDSLDSQQAYLEQVKTVFDGELENIKEISTQIIQIDSVKSLVLKNSEETDSFESVLDLYYDLENLHFTSPILSSYCIVFKDSNVVYNQGSVNSLNNFFSTTYSMKNYTEKEFLDKLFSRYYFLEYLAPTEIVFENAKPKYCLPIITTIGYGPNHAKAAIIAFIDLDYFKTMSLEYQNLKGGILSIQGEDGTILFPSDYEKQIQTDQKYLTLKSASSVMDWDYVLTRPESEVFEKAISYQKKALIITIFFIIISAVLIIIFAFLPFNPMKKLLFRNDELQENINRQKENLRNIFLERWLNGNFSTENEMKLYSPYLYKEYQGKNYLIIVIRIDDELLFQFKNSADSLSNEYQKIKEKIKTILIDKMNFNTNNFHELEVNKIVYVVVDSTSTQTELVENIQKKIISMEDIFIAQELKNVHVSKGSVVQKMGNISTSLEVALNCFFDSENQDPSISYEKRELTLLHFTPEMKIKLSQMVRGGNVEGVSLLLESFIKNNIKKIENSDILLRSLAYELWGTTINIVSKITSLPDAIRNPIIVDYMNLKKLKDLDKIQHCISGLSLMTEYCQQVKKDKHNKLADNIKNYVKENFYDRNLGLQNIADKFELSTAYVSQIFKNNFELNFIDYLQNIRIEKAQFLLVTTQYKVKEIYKMCGYSSSNTFSKAFRRKCGVSALEYRRQYKVTEIK